MEVRMENVKKKRFLLFASLMALLGGRIARASQNEQCQELVTMLAEAKKCHLSLPPQHSIIKSLPLFNKMATIRANLMLARQEPVPKIPVRADCSLFTENAIIDGIKVTQLRSVKQPKFGCASFAIRNVGAALALLKAGRSLTAENIEAEFNTISIAHDAYIAAAGELLTEIASESPLEQWYDKDSFEISESQKRAKEDSVKEQLLSSRSVPFNLGIDWLKISDLTALASYLKLDRTYFLELRFWDGDFVNHSKNGNIYRKPLPTIPLDFGVNFLGDSVAISLEEGFAELLVVLECCKNINFPEALYVPVCCVGDRHWRTIVIIKNPGEKAYLLVLDSQNESFNAQKGAYGPETKIFIEHLVAMLVD